LRLTARHPLTGVGPGGIALVWTTSDGRTVISRYAHNEYLQVLVQLGVIGFLLLLALLAAITRTVWQSRAAAPSPQLWAGVAAGLVALAVHSGLDFLWHIPAIPLLGALLIGLTTPISLTQRA
jgi:O-antigen ligase